MAIKDAYSNKFLTPNKVSVTASAGNLPTADGSITIADASTPTVDELLEFCVELKAKLDELSED